NEAKLVKLINQRVDRHVKEGVTTIEIKSGYGLNVDQELKQLRAIKEASKTSRADLIATCLGAHIVPHDFGGTAPVYLEYLLSYVLPKVAKEKLATRVDIFI